ncbi:hypothetical protein RJ640_018357 [Escallonia rubra]|uniref:Myb-like domain-containing protein n=1 Tax=Escallonia rubra TaxID=112253 RepID=A0AA88UTG5_9ASTE|nr:hypothetical protein RJ640_018357 [Escallonia rubra]
MQRQDGGDGRRQKRPSTGSLRTRSQVAPDWTVEESLILVNEVSAVEAECLNTLSSFQKWQAVVDNCNALDVRRNLSQCRRKWDSLLADYMRAKKSKSGPSEGLNSDLFKAIDGYFRVRKDGCDSDRDTLVLSVSKKKRRSIMPRKRFIAERVKHPTRCVDESLKSQKSSKSEKLMPEQCGSEEKIEPLTHCVDEDKIHEQISHEEKEQMIASRLCENVELINSIVEGHSVEDGNCKSSDSIDGEAALTETIRRDGDELIVCLGNLVNTLDQLRHLVEGCGRYDFTAKWGWIKNPAAITMMANYGCVPELCHERTTNGKYPYLYSTLGDENLGIL